MSDTLDVVVELIAPHIQREPAQPAIDNVVECGHASLVALHRRVRIRKWVVFTQPRRPPAVGG